MEFNLMKKVEIPSEAQLVKNIGKGIFYKGI